MEKENATSLRATILLVDDRPENLLVLEDVLEDMDCRILKAQSGQDALRLVLKHDLALVFLDVQMPGMDGFEVAELMRRKQRAQQVPIIFVTAINKEQKAVFKGYESGAVDYLFKPFEPAILKSKAQVFIELYKQRRLSEAQAEKLERQTKTLDEEIHRRKRAEEVLKTGRDQLEVLVKERTAELTTVNERLRCEVEKHQRTEEELERAMKGTIQAMTLATEIRDPYTAGHQKRVARLAGALAEEMGLPETQIEGIRLAALVHDLGKIYVPAEILSKPGRLTEIEFALIKTHPQIGHDILKTVDFPWPIAEIVYQHQERLDGSGYPQGLSGDDILLETKIISVADVLESMYSHRPYRPALGIEQALQEILDNRGILYDCDAVDACVTLFHEGKFSFYHEAGT